MRATIYWHWWGWGHCEIQTAQGDRWQVGRGLFAAQLPVYRQTCQGLEVLGKVQARALNGHYLITLPHAGAYQLGGSRGAERFQLSQKGQALLFLKKQSPMIYLQSAHKEAMVGTAVPEVLTGYAAVWHAEINVCLSDLFPLELLSLALVLRENHWSHHTSRA